MEQDPKLAQRPEDLDAEHQDDQERGHRHGAGADAPGSERQSPRGPHRDDRVGDAARERVASEHPHRAPEELASAQLELAGARPALAKGLERRQTLHRVEEVGAEGRSEEHTSELQSRQYLVCRLLLEKKKKKK